jgi:hypothetical protein
VGGIAYRGQYPKRDDEHCETDGSNNAAGKPSELQIRVEVRVTLGVERELGAILLPESASADWIPSLQELA